MSLKLRPKAVIVPGFPGITQLPTWKSSVARGLVAASVALPVDRKEVQWFNEIEGKSYDELSDSGAERYHRLDSLLAESLTNVLPKQLAIRVQQTSWLNSRTTTA